MPSCPSEADGSDNAGGKSKPGPAPSLIRKKREFEESTWPINHFQRFTAPSDSVEAQAQAVVRGVAPLGVSVLQALS